MSYSMDAPRWICLIVSLLILFSGADTWGAQYEVKAGENLQTYLDRAVPGDELLLEPQAEFVGNFSLRAKGGSAFITVRTGAPKDRLPLPNQRTAPAYHSVLAKLRTPNANSVVSTEAGASYWRLENLEFVTLSPGGTDTLVNLGRGDAVQNSLEQVPFQIVLDRILVDVPAGTSLKRGIGLHSRETAIINSYIAGVKIIGYDSQAICGWNGPGPYTIENNHLEGAGENIMFGGARTAIPQLTPSDITIRRNHIMKPWSWWPRHPLYAGTNWTVKNLLELKHAKRVTIEGNILENNWASAQGGTAILFTTRSEEGTMPWAVVSNVAMRNNVVAHTAGGLAMLCHDEKASGHMTDMVVANNLWIDIDPIKYAQSNGWMFSVFAGPANVWFDHNTTFLGSSLGFMVIGEVGHKAEGFRLTNSFACGGVGASGIYDGDTTFQTWLTAPWVVSKNVFPGLSVERYKSVPDNFFVPAEQYPALFANATFEGYRLADGSPYKNAGTDGKDIGVDIAQLRAAMDGIAPQAPANLRSVR